MKSENGFTLIEILITIAIIGIVGSIAIMNSQKFYSNYKVKEAARQIYSDMQAARIYSIKGGSRWAICFFPGTTFTSYSVRNTPGADNTFCTSDDPTSGASPFYIKNVDLSGSGFSSLTFNQNSSGMVIFNPTGTASADCAVSITSGARTITVTVNKNSGNVKIQ